MKNITIMDIAKEAGVSKATVSRVMSNPSIVRKATRERILAIMEKYSYIPNHLAQGLSGSPTNMIGILIDELANFFFIEVTEGIDTILSPKNYSMQITSSRWIYEREIELVRSLISSRVDGVLLAPVRPDSQAIEMLKQSHIPFIVMNCIPEDPTVSFVACDNKRGGELAAEFINNNVQDQVVLITGFNDQSMQHRVQGFTSKIDRRFVFRQYEGINTLEAGYDLVPRLMEETNLIGEKTTLFVTNDNVAIGIINRLCELDLDIPDQVSIIGYDDIRLASLCRVPLTTISQSGISMGSISANMLIELINGNVIEPYRHLITPRLVIRQSI
ncbi:MAG: LacI family DNA-binding transcriptional regulator [Sphaerochaetaceae bacterium]|jgi:DNA-binding LacI/PurR family transcriptional regulator|nr:LacI family DNA-binding transcriptional regulator [Sphaerochaetaceae bacterium]